jgi:hypothetical protein
MDYDKARAPQSGYVCEACLFSMAERSPELQARAGKDKPQCMRNYSHFVLHGQWLPLSKSQKREMYEILRQDPELSVIAISGQKHLIFRARPSRWQVEEQSIVPDVARLDWLMERVEALYSGGFGKQEIASGGYTLWRIGQFGVKAWEALEHDLRAYRGSALFELVVFLVQKGEDSGQGDAGGPCDESGVVSVAGNCDGLQAEVCAGDLGSIPGAATRRGHGDGQPEHVRQRTLF